MRCQRFSVASGHGKYLPTACGVLLAMTAASPRVLAQNNGDDFLSRTSPTPAYRSSDSTQYNLKWGKVTGRFSGSTVAEFNDNINLSENNRKADFYIGPEVGFGILWPITQANVLQLDFGVGYRYYLNSPSISTVTISPKSNSHLDYYLYVGDVRINFHDTFAVQVDPTDLAQLSGGPSTLIDFRRVINDSGVTIDWRATKSITLYGSYDYTLYRSLSSQFQELDRDDHTFGAGINKVVSPRLTVGAGATYTISDYTKQVQNDGDSFTVGPHLTYKVTQFITLDASAGYSISTFSNDGTIGDTSSFHGLTYNIDLKHRINKRTSQELRFSYGVSAGIGSNFSKDFSLQYDVSYRLTSAVTLNGAASYERLTGSDFLVENADRYLITLGGAFRIAPRWSMGAAYTLSWKDSNMPLRNYVQNRITLDLTHQF